jgi:hypothetical protein
MSLKLPESKTPPKIRHRRQRIAWSVVWGALAVSLCVLWVRSYWCRDTFSGPSLTTGCSFFFSQNGEIQYMWDSQVTPTHGWNFGTYPAPENRLSAATGHWNALQGSLSVVIPHWALLLLTLTIAALSWVVPQRFSLRMLFIAITLIAASLGVIVAFKK